MTNPHQTRPRNLTRYAWLSIAAALVTIGLKLSAYLLTDSVGLLSDAAESVVNLVAAVVALYALHIAAKPADKNHNFGHSKAEYFSAWVEGMMIVIAAGFIVYTAIGRLLNPREIDNVGIGLVISIVAAVVNGVVAVVLLRAGRRFRSQTLKADGQHLMTDVWTSAGVVVGVLLVALTGWPWLDPVIALAVGVNILVAGYKLVSESTDGLMDSSWSKEDNRELAGIVRAFRSHEVDIHALRTRLAGHHRYVEMHVLVPGEWSVWKGHDLIEEIEQTVQARFEDVEVMCHLEPIEDPRAYGDYPAEIQLQDAGPRTRYRHSEPPAIPEA
ncbi:cation diffusion facilitator family transporter [Blastococcus sp. Marseille-P5729]|uniref:cation diffusion facilitator family transporter n=1 Tax=Blastococcus sp. Marseille-P5729 TaxID=2086582 RepID=UPI000D104940|nr:cation diffusion facilitator family transporter [Blastococcus sp. Marseille-P5729]